MKKHTSLLIVAVLFILSGCSDFKKVNLEDYSVNINLRNDMVISSNGMEAQQYLKQLTLNDFELNVAGDSVKLKTNEKNHVEIERLGEVIIRIQLDGVTISSIELWMTDEQLSQID